jgi:hypothetical protein
MEYIEYLPKDTIEVKELPSTQELIIKVTYDEFFKCDWKPLRQYLKSKDWKILFIIKN